MKVGFVNEVHGRAKVLAGKSEQRNRMRRLRWGREFAWRGLEMGRGGAHGLCKGILLNVFVKKLGWKSKKCWGAYA